MNARAGAGEHRVLAVVAVPLHQREIEIAVGHVARDVVPVRRGVELLEAEDVLVERGRLVEVVDSERKVDDARLGAALAQFVPANVDELRHAAVRCAELERAFLLVGENRAATLLDRCAHRIAVLDLDAEVMNAGPGPGELRLRLVLAVVGHEREIDGAFRHVARGVAARVAGLELVDAEHVLVELGGPLQVLDLERDVDDASHCCFLLARQSATSPFVPRKRGPIVCSVSIVPWLWVPARALTRLAGTTASVIALYFVYAHVAKLKPVPVPAGVR